MTAHSAAVARAYATLREQLRQLPAELRAQLAHAADELDRCVAELVNHDRAVPVYDRVALEQEHLEGWAEHCASVELDARQRAGMAS